MLCANNKGADQPAHLRNLINTFVVHYLDSIISLVSISEISSLYLASVAAQAGLSLTWSKIPKTDVAHFCRDNNLRAVKWWHLEEKCTRNYTSSIFDFLISTSLIISCIHLSSVCTSMDGLWLDAGSVSKYGFPLRLSESTRIIRIWAIVVSEIKFSLEIPSDFLLASDSACKIKTSYELELIYLLKTIQ